MNNAKKHTTNQSDCIIGIQDCQYKYNFCINDLNSARRAEKYTLLILFCIV